MLFGTLARQLYSVLIGEMTQASIDKRFIGPTLHYSNHQLDNRCDWLAIRRSSSANDA